jgi:hypothetical protein
MNGELIRQTMKRLGRSMIALPDLRCALARELPGMAFDQAINALADAVRVDLHIHSHPAWLEPEERAALVKTPRGYAIGIVWRRD